MDYLGGQGLRELLLVNAIRRGLTVSHAIGALAVIVDAVDDGAYIFDEYFELQALPDQPSPLDS
ncbi:MAG: hypothetical protein IT294_02855 [Deltaproteobacteria bacterium]|nr:hypothetical protein [Deltaproteobacteria bacterium]